MTDLSQPKFCPPADLESGLRDLVVSHLRRGHTHEAINAARDLLDVQPGRRTHRFLRNVVESDDTAPAELRPLKVALLSSFSIEFLHDSLIAQGLLARMRIEIHQAAFGTFRRELLDPDSALYRWSPDVVILAVEGEDWSPEAFGSFLEVPESGIRAVAERFHAEVKDILTTFRKHSKAPLLVHNLALPTWPKLAILDAKSAHGQGHLVTEMNNALAIIANEVADVHLVNYAALVNRHGALNWYDERMKLFARAPVASSMQSVLSAEYIKYLRALLGLARKCLVVDLDNTLWGGVIGEDGLAGISLGPAYPGSAFVEFQKALLDLHRRGVILAIASKNNPADVDEVFSKHDFMVLRREHFSSIQIHWDSKAQSLARIAEELSIGLEHMVFIDDNPVECQQIRGALPMVRVIHLPPQPERYARTVEQAAEFDTLSISVEDRRRGELYRQRAQAEAARLSMTSVEDYYRDLAMEVTIAPVDDITLRRTAQLTQKTNQFNATTLRYSEAELASRIVDPQWVTSTVAVKDRFGDNGIVGVLMAKEIGDSLDIDTLLLSCRVIGRTVETALLAQLCDEAQRRGLRAITGRMIPTAKNVPAQDVFERHGFAKTAQDASGTAFWRLELAGKRVEWPSWLANRSSSASDLLPKSHA